MADTPESVRHLAEEELAEIYTESRKAENTVSAAVDALTRYAELLEQGNARIRELEAQIAEHEKVRVSPLREGETIESRCKQGWNSAPRGKE